MSRRVRMTLIVLGLLVTAPDLALAGVCFDVTGLPEEAALDIVPLAAAPQGLVPLSGQAQGVCGLGQAPALVQGIAILEPSVHSDERGHRNLPMSSCRAGGTRAHKSRLQNGDRCAVPRSRRSPRKEHVGSPRLG